jgi:hypothetical protein
MGSMETVVGHGVIYHPHTLPGRIAVVGGERVGLLTYHIAGGQCEVVSIDSTQSNQGVGTALLAAIGRGSPRVGLPAYLADHRQL